MLAVIEFSKSLVVHFSKLTKLFRKRGQSTKTIFACNNKRGEKMENLNGENISLEIHQTKER